MNCVLKMWTLVLYYLRPISTSMISCILFLMFQATDLATAPVTTGAPTAAVSVRPTCATPSATASPTALTKSTVNLSTRRSMVGGSCANQRCLCSSENRSKNQSSLTYCSHTYLLLLTSQPPSLTRPLLSWSVNC